MTIRVLLADDQDLVRAGFAMVLGSQPDIEVTGEAADGRAAVRLARERPADVFVMDVRMPALDGVAATAEICRAGERPRVLILTTFDLDEYAFTALRARASGFLLKSAPPEELLYAVRCVHNGDAVVAPSTTRRLIGRFMPHLPAAEGLPRDRPPALAGLTAREREVLTEVAAAGPTRRSPGCCTSPRRPSRATSATLWPSSACATASRWSSTPTRPASSPRRGAPPELQGFRRPRPPGRR